MCQNYMILYSQFVCAVFIFDKKLNTHLPVSFCVTLS